LETAPNPENLAWEGGFRFGRMGSGWGARRPMDSVGTFGSGLHTTMRHTHRTALLGSLPALLLASACVLPQSSASYPVTAPARWTGYVPDLPISQPPFTEVHASWKQRIDQPYVYIEHIGSYTDTGSLIPLLQREMVAQGLEPAGPPFALYFDDPGTVPPARLRSRACLPIGGPRSPKAPLQYDVLPSTTVVYAVIGGPYPDVPRAYPGLYAYLAKQGWVENGPVRETYLIPPTSVSRWDELMTEVQIPAAAPR
jgi:effector-binding domain-containing protein